MELLFKREQTPGTVKDVTFSLWGKLEVTSDEEALINRYQFNQAVLIAADDSALYAVATKIAGAVFVVATPISYFLLSNLMFAFLLGSAAGLAAGYWHFNEKRQTIRVQDLLVGRTFICKSVVELAKKEAWVESACAVFRQVMESAKHWDGVERHTIEPLPKAEAKEMILRAF